MRTIQPLQAAFCGLALFVATGMPDRVHAAGANIVWVSFHSADNTPSSAAAGAGFTQAPDVEYTQLLAAAGHTVTRYVTTATPDVTFLNSFDLVIISRSVPSGNYQTEESTALWHSITAPTLQLGGYILRANRLGYVTGDALPDAGGPIHLTVLEPSHPIFTGVSLDGSGTMVNLYADLVTHNGTLQRGISINTDLPVDGATLLATVATDTDPTFGSMVIGEYPAGTLMYDIAGSVAAGKRLVFLTGSRENDGLTAEGSGIFDLEADGVRLFLNAVSYLAGVEVTEPPPLISQLRPASGTTQYYAPRGISFRATSGSAGGIPEGNITLVLNGTDVSASLVVAGTPQDRTASYLGLVANLEYTGTLTVRDADGQESVVPLSFDTLPAFGLPPSFAYPADSGVATAAGMRARIVQGYEAPPTLANTAERAEGQLAGTLIDPDTGEPFPNWATPSTDNPDGSYNQPIINWSVEADGLGLEQGNFQAPTFPDELIPGINHNFNIAAEVVAYLELTPGRYVMGVNSDDGFVVYSGVDTQDLLRVSLGRFDGGRGSADTLFQFDVSQAGVYPFRLLYYQGDGGANLEWFLVDPLTDEKVLINDSNHPEAVRAWRQLSVPARPYIASADPAPGQGSVPTDATVTVVLQDGGAEVQQETVQLSLDGQTVAAQVNKTGGQTTVQYAPASGFQGDTTYTVGVSYTDSEARPRTATFEFTTRFVPPVVPEGANIVWVSFHPADDEPAGGAASAGFTEAPDVGYTQLLESAGHTVTRYVTSSFPDVDYLNTFDLVIISRSAPSTDYQSADSTALWHSITAPTLHLGGYLLRANRLGFTTGDTIPDTAANATIRLKVNVPTHPIFAGIALDAASDMVNAYAQPVSFQGTVQRGLSVNTSPVVSGATVLATVGTVGDPAFGGMVIGEYPAGTTMGNASADVTAGKRLVLLTGSRENDGLTAEGAGIFNLAGDGPRLFLNAVSYMAGLPGPAPEIDLAVVLSPQDELVISWPEAGSQDLVLQSSPALVPANWQPVSEQPVVSDGQRRVTIPTSDTARYFQLVEP